MAKRMRVTKTFNGKTTFIGKRIVWIEAGTRYFTREERISIVYELADNETSKEKNKVILANILEGSIVKVLVELS